MSRRSMRVALQTTRQSRRIRGLSPEPSEEKSPPTLPTKSKKKGGTWTFRFTITDEEKELVDEKDYYKRISINLDKGPDMFQGQYCLDVGYYGIRHLNGKQNYGEPVLTVAQARVCNIARLLQLHSYKWNSQYFNWYMRKCSHLGIIHRLNEVIVKEEDIYNIDWVANKKQQFILLEHEEECTLFGGYRVKINSQKEIERIDKNRVFFYGKVMYTTISAHDSTDKDKIINILYYMNERKNAKSIDSVLKCSKKLLEAHNFSYGVIGKTYNELGSGCWDETLLPLLERHEIEITKKNGRFLFDIAVTINNENEILVNVPFFKQYFVVDINGGKNFGAEIKMDFNPKNEKLRVTFAMLQQQNDVNKTVNGQDVLENEIYV